jgi:hypothetical protein
VQDAAHAQGTNNTWGSTQRGNSWEAAGTRVYYPLGSSEDWLHLCRTLGASLLKICADSSYRTTTDARRAAELQCTLQFGRPLVSGETSMADVPEPACSIMTS